MASPRALVAQLARFGIVGIVATVVHVGVAWGAHRLGAEPYLANALGFAVAFGCSYAGHFYWTFGQRSGHAARLPRFVIVAGAGFALSNAIVWAVVTAGGYPFDLALLAIVLVVPPSTWALSRLWAFR